MHRHAFVEQQCLLGTSEIVQTQAWEAQPRRLSGELLGPIIWVCEVR
jgi:hypothetical protein